MPVFTLRWYMMNNLANNRFFYMERYDIAAKNERPKNGGA